MDGSHRFRRRDALDVDQLERRLDHVREQVVALERHAVEHGAKPTAHAVEALEDLGKALDELRIAKESLRERDARLEALAGERKRADQELRDVTRRLEAIVDAAPVALIVTDLDATVAMWNPAAEEIFGWKRQEVLGQRYPLVPADQWDDAMATVARIAHGETLTVERRRQRKDGTLIDVRAAVAPLRNGGASVVGALGVIEDVSERKRAADALRASEERFRTSVENMLDSFGIYSAIRTSAGAIVDFRVEYVNHAACESNRMTREQQLGERLLEILPAHRESGLFDEYCRVVETGEPLVRESLVYEDTYGGRVLARAFDLRATRLGDGFAAAWRDITDRKRAEAQIALQGAIVGTMAEGVVLVRARDATIVHANPAFEALLGYAPGELDGRPIAAVNAPTDRTPEETAAAIIAALERDGAWHGEIENVRKDGTRFWCWASVSTFEHPEHGTVWISAHTDITRRKLAEEELMRLNAELELRVQERTRDLAARTRELEAANAELEAFSYSASHDLRAPLRAIDGFSRLVLEQQADRLDAKGRHALERVRAGSQRMGLLIDEMLKLSRLTRRPMEREPVDLSALAEEIAAELRAEHPERQVEVSIQPGLLANGDRELLRAALTNLLGNGWKFTAEDPLARVDFGCCDQGGEKVFFVRDNGVGFDMAYADKLFRPFERLHAEKRFTGTGVGLATVGRVVRRHGGRVWAEGEVGEGATFFFTLIAGGQQNHDPAEE